MKNAANSVDAALKEFDALHRELLAEVRRVTKCKMAGENSIFPNPADLDSIDRRLVVRSVISYIESLSFLIDRIAESKPLPLSEWRLADEKPMERQHNKSGKVGRHKPRRDSDVEGVFKRFAELKAFPFIIDASSDGWLQIKSSFDVRNRITHPKSVEDVNISDEEIWKAVHGFHWFNAQCAHAFTAYGQHLRRTALLTPTKDTIES